MCSKPLLTLMLALTTIGAATPFTTTPQHPKRQTPSVIQTGTLHCIPSIPPILSTGDCIAAIDGFSFNEVTDNKPIKIPAKGFTSTFGGCTVKVRFFGALDGVAVKNVPRQDLAQAIPAILGGDVGALCELPLFYVPTSGLVQSGSVVMFNPISF